MRPWCANAREVVVPGGEGATVVLAHGYGMDQASWDKILPSITKANKVVLFDWDFTAGAEDGDEARYTFARFADDLIALMDERDVRGAVLVGHSMSAMVGCIAAARQPDLFAHLLLLCASPRYINSEEEGYVGGFEEAAIHGMLGAMESDFQAWVKGFVPNAAGGAADDMAAATMEPLERSFLAMDPAVALGVARMIFLGDQRPALDTVPTQCTIVGVRHDFAAPPVVAEYMERRMTKAGTDVAVEIVESVGHFPQLVAPTRVAGILDGVLLRLRHKGLSNGHDGTEEEDTTVPAATEVEIDGGIDVTT
ncbi:probable esterase D14L [Triticum dicoccoides]|uniref:probable esterase D14L n=1 Tax=Triticum dicoccoides TaxID=85692 RepID=UPI000E799242|nr:probable esterase D14L [Triticum dicoccoides]